MLLIISQNKSASRSIAETFYYMSILAHGANPHEGLSEISNLYRAVLILNPDAFPDIIDYVNRLKSYQSNIPIFALTDKPQPLVYSDIFEKCFMMPNFTPALAQKIISYANENNRARIGDYRLAGFDASNDVLGVSYFYDKVSFTKTEAMILRYLIRSYPNPSSPEDIIKYAFKASKSPEPSSIKTHISVMNNKLEAVTGKRMLGRITQSGYVILTPELEKRR